VRSTLLPFSPPQIDETEVEAVVAALRSGWLTTGPKTQEFAESFAAMVGAPAALPVNSCTAALHIALAAWGVGPGDLVFTTPMTFTSTVHVIEHLKATPVLVDVDVETLCIDPNLLAKAVSDVRAGAGTPKVLLPVHYAGQPADLDPILDLAAERNLKVLEDAAHSLPAAYRGRPIGDVAHESVERAVAFSFYATKNLTTGEGGMLTGTPDFIAESKLWSLHGMGKDAWKRYGAGGSWHYEVTRPGFKYNMTEIQAALGQVQMTKLEAMDARRREIAHAYTAGFAEVTELIPPTERSDRSHAWHLYTLRLALSSLSIGRDRFIDELAARNISTSVHFIPIHHHRYYAEKYGFDPELFPVATAAFRAEVSLPIYPSMSDDDVRDVVVAVCDVVARNRA
jgi:dTDP-4-amino-4,6-dideoxygalactose transaminase